MRKYSTKEVSKLVNEDGLGYSIEKYYNDYNFQDVELTKLWKEARRIFRKINEKLEEANITEKEMNLKIINEFLDIFNKNTLTLNVGVGNIKEDWGVYEIYSKEKGQVFLIDWEKGFENVQLFFSENAFDKNYLEALKNQYECIQVDDYNDKLNEEDQEPIGYTFNIPSIYELKEILVNSIPEIFKK